MNSKFCGQCVKQPPLFNHTFAPFHYQPPIDKLTMGIKFGRNLVYARVLGELMAKNIGRYLIEADKPDCLIPVPLHHTRLRERGFNQALELAKPIAKQLQIPIDFRSCKRVRATLAQTLIPAATRQRNVRNAFLVAKDFFAPHVAILDDVVTTGSTVTELSRILLQAGVKKISIWCCARTDVVSF
jgi:ComF family protein